MRVENVRRVIAAMEATDDSRFNIRYVFSIDGQPTEGFGTVNPGRSECGTAACVVGWSAWVAGDEIPCGRQGQAVGFSSVRDWLGIGFRLGQEIFMPGNYFDPGDNSYTRLRAIAVLRDLVEQHEAGAADPMPRWNSFSTTGEAA